MYYYTWAYVALVLGIVVCLYALVRGGPAERAGAVIYLAGWLATTVVQTMSGGVEWGIMAVDTVGLVAFVILCLWTRKIWTVLIAACQLDAVASHIAALMAPQFSYVTYITVIGFWGGYGLLACLAAGTYGYRRDMRLQRIWGKTPFAD
jgi:hypothetical protein